MISTTTTTVTEVILASLYRTPVLCGLIGEVALFEKLWKARAQTFVPQKVGGLKVWRFVPQRV